jgi:signal transduction histidine kinase
MIYRQQLNIRRFTDAGKRLSKIVNQLLQCTQTEAGRIRLEPVPASPAAIVAYAVNSIKIAARQKGVRLQIRSASRLSAVFADVEKTGWVLVNFLSNALRYSAERSRIIIQLTEKNDSVIFSVRDFGKGIDPRFQKRLFVRYFQVPADAGNMTGSGLGLAIAKEIIEAQSGEIWLKSTVGQGSVFSFSLPVITPQPH